MNMQENTSSQEKKEVKKVKGSYFEVPGVPISDIKGESDTKKTQGSVLEVSGIPKSDLKGESGTKSEETVDEKKTSAESAPFERKEPKDSDFTAPEELETGYTEKSWAKPEENMAGKEPEKEAQILERKEPNTKEFTAPGELETGYTEKSWAKPESMEVKAAEGTGEAREKEASEGEAREKEASEKEAREKEAREEKRTVYNMEKRLTKSKTDRKLFGVCGGLGEYFGIDPTLVRLAFVLLGLLHGIGLILYIVLAIIMPSEKSVEMVPSYRK